MLRLSGLSLPLDHAPEALPGEPDLDGVLRDLVLATAAR
jgi:hypothetical protein